MQTRLPAFHAMLSVSWTFLQMFGHVFHKAIHRSALHGMPFLHLLSAIPSFHLDVMNRSKVLTGAFLFSHVVPAYLLFLPLNPEFVHHVVLNVLARIVNWTLLFLRMQLRKIRRCLYRAGILAAS